MIVLNSPYREVIGGSALYCSAWMPRRRLKRLFRSWINDQEQSVFGLFHPQGDHAENCFQRGHIRGGGANHRQWRDCLEDSFTRDSMASQLERNQ